MRKQMQSTWLKEKKNQTKNKIKLPELFNERVFLLLPLFFSFSKGGFNFILILLYFSLNQNYCIKVFEFWEWF